MTQPYFPVDMTAMSSKRSYTEISAKAFQVDDFKIRPTRLNHPQGCLSYRIENNGKSVVFATDTEPGNRQADRALREVCKGADILIYDSQYECSQLDREKKGWGHSCWEEGVKICQENDVKELILFHHDPDCDDLAIDALQERARTRFPNTRAAYEVMDIIL
jgi:ribonuclease BN (tRNA processing enzyme)